MRLTLLKSATSPDPDADQGEHFMTYSLLPHQGDWRNGVIDEAYDLNDPLILRRVNGTGSQTKALGSLLSTSEANVVIETIKLAEDGHGLIVRMYEDQRNRGKAIVTTSFALAEAYQCNILEENEAALPFSGNEVQIDFAPYQIITLRLIPQR
jgi:alpha-mannosidase